MSGNDPSNPSDGWDLYTQNDFTGAERAFRADIAKNPNDIVALNGLFNTVFSLGRYQEAIEVAIRTAPLVQSGSVDQSYNLYSWALALRKSGALAEAKAKAQQLTASFPKFALGHYLLGLIHDDEKNFEDAVRAFRAALEANPNDVNSADMLVNSLNSLKRPVEELQALSQLNDLQKAANLPDRARTLRNWAIVLRDQGDVEAALEKAQELVDTFPDYAPGWNTRAITRQAKGDLGGAISDYRKALAVGKDAAERRTWMSNLGDALRKNGNSDDAVATYRELLALEPGNATTENAMGLALADLKRFGDAIACYERAIALWRQAGSPDLKYALRNLADAYIARKEPKLAEAKLREAVIADDRDPTTRNSLGVALAKDHPDQAIREYREALRLWALTNDPNRKLALQNWAIILTERNQFSQAEAVLREALEADPNDPDIRNSLGLALVQHAPDAAIEQYELACELCKDSPNRRKSMRFWANALRILHNYEAAATKCREALAVPGDVDEPWIYLELGYALLGAGHDAAALVELSKARAVVAKDDRDRRFILWAIGNASLKRERLDDALAAYKEAAALSPEGDYSGPFLYGIALATAGDAEAALEQYNEAISKDETHPYAYNNKAALLFRLGDYEKGWPAWAAARIRYEPVKAILEDGAFERARMSQADCVDRTVYYANALRDVYSEYQDSLQLYELALKASADFTPAVCGRAVLLRRMSRGEHPKVATEMLGGQAMRESCEQLQQNLDGPDAFINLLVLADLHIEERDWPRVGKMLDRAEQQCEEMRLRRLEVLVRRGILLLATDKPDEAARLFQQALVYRPGDLAVKSYLGRAFLNAKQYEAALRVFREVLDVAPGHVESLILSAQTNIELAESGDVDHYVLAEKFLADSLRFGRDQGSLRLRDVDIADVYYMRGYARTKRYEADTGVFRSLLLVAAFNDFRQASKHDPRHALASIALKKVAQQMARRSGGSVADIAGPIMVSVAATIVFALAQIDFFLRGTRLHQWLAMPADSALQQPGYYATVTFSALAVMIAGVSLRKLLKLKIAGIELERTAPAPLASAAALGIGRFNQFDSFMAFTLQGLGSTPNDLRKPATNPESQGAGEGKEPSVAKPDNATPTKVLIPAG